MAYVDGFVIAIPKKNLAAYCRMALLGRDVWKEHGALDYKECVLEDAAPKGVAMTFAKLAKLKPGETVVFSYVVYKSRAHRDSVNKKVMADPRITGPMEGLKMPFDMKRFSYGGFKAFVEL